MKKIFNTYNRSSFISISLIVVIVFLRTNLLFGQGIIGGLIIDSKTENPIQNANIVVSGTKLGASSDKNGNFMLQASTFPLTLMITHVSYEDLNIQITFSNENIIAKLSSKTVFLNPIPITSAFVTNVIDTSVLNILDYEFYNSNLLALTQNYATSEYFLMLYATSGRLIIKKKLNIKPMELFKDCLNNIHLVGKENSFEISLSDNRIELFNSIQTLKFNNLLPRCLEALEGRYYFNQYLTKKQVLSYYYTKDDNSLPIKIAEITDELAVKMWKDEARFASLGGIKYDEFDVRFAELCVYKPIYAPLVKFKDTLFLFDFVNDRISQYSKDHTVLKQMPISFHKEKGWEKDLFVDEGEKKMYVHYRRNGISTIKELNTQSGNLGRSVEVTQMPFVENIKIHNGRIYFTYKVSNENNVRKLYSIRTE